jgi:hypothetical protein
LRTPAADRLDLDGQRRGAMMAFSGSCFRPWPVLGS